MKQVILKLDDDHASSGRGRFIIRDLGAALLIHAWACDAIERRLEELHDE
eukprot:CAMPEP_0174897684 /NCGR_PEP_ID=MMETSP0167-20121228/15899_1 /TAXON_ID=38298 /ORGANISM="Rhodella maculata, Strain CCMP736" /LENGTH=49 /DNA_ID= /DNA_START= /DNA_END= /DNA_ORIENTATION=